MLKYEVRLLTSVCRYKFVERGQQILREAAWSFHTQQIQILRLTNENVDDRKQKYALVFMP